MGSEIAYMLGVVLIGFAVNYTLRAFPFIIFAGRDKALPAWVESFGKIISPIIIAGLIIYSYSGLAWKTAWPYLAGAITIGIHLWKRNPLLSIVAGTVLYMCLLTCGCVTDSTIELDASNPAVRYTASGIYFNDTKVNATDVPKILAEHDIPKNRTIHILLDENIKEVKGARYLMNCLAREGYTQSVLVTKRRAESWKNEKKESRSAYGKPASSRTKTIRYKKSSE